MVRVLLLAFFLASCGGDDGDSSSSSNFFSFIGADPYVVDGVFFYDQNNNGIYDEGELVSNPTDSNGNGSFSSIIPAGGKIIQLVGGVMDGFNYNGRLKGISNGIGGIVISPLTTLSANGFTNDEIVAMLNGVGITITSGQINQNPMSDPNLLRAALTVSQGLSESLKRYDLEPSDITVQGPKAYMNDNYTQQLFAEASQVFGQVINENEFNSNLTNLSKVSSSFFNYMKLFGASDFASSTEIDNAKSALYSVVDDSTNSFEPLNLVKTTSGYEAKVLKNEWFNDGTYDLIGLYASNIYTRIINNTISNYPFSPWEVEIVVAPATVSGETISLPTQSSKSETWKVNSTSDLVDYSSSYNQDNLSKPSNAQVVNGLPISTYNRINNLILRGSSFNPESPSINGKNLRLVGDGEGVYTYYGIDWGENPSDPEFWIVNQSRTNNCIIGDQPTANCDDDNVTYYYNSQKENSSEKSFSALTQASDLGNSLPLNFEMNFAYKIAQLGATTTNPPVEIIISEIGTQAANLISVDCPSKPNKKCLAVKVDTETNSRPPLEDTEGIAFSVGYNSLSNYKVYAVNEIKVKTGEGEGKYCETKNTSSFFKSNMLILKINCSTNFPQAEYLFIDLSSRRGVVGSYPYPWQEGTRVKFQYRNFSEISLKNVLP